MNSHKKAAVTELNAFYLSAKKTDKVFVEKRDFYSLTYRYEGKISVETNDQKLFSAAGSVTFIPKGVSYTTEIIEDMRMAVVQFKLNGDVDFRNVATREECDVSIRALFERLIRNFHIDSPVDFHCMSVFYELLTKLEKLGTTAGARVPEKIRQAKKRIEQGYSAPTLYVEALANELGISTAYLRREFSRAYGTAPNAFLRAVRIGHAKNMLETGFLSIGEIAEQCGFSSAGYFIQVFHRTVGESPDQYRRHLFGKQI